MKICIAFTFDVDAFDFSQILSQQIVLEMKSISFDFLPTQLSDIYL